MRDRDITSLGQLGLPPDFGGFDFASLDCGFLSGQSDLGILNFSMDSEVSCYRHRSTGLVIPIGTDFFLNADMTSVSWETVHTKRPNIIEAHFEAFRREFEFYGLFDMQLLRADLAKLATKLERLGKPFIVVEPFDDIARLDRKKYRSNRAINQTVRECLCVLTRLARFVSFSDCVESADEEIEPNHFQRGAYVRLAEVLRREVENALGGAAGPGAGPANQQSPVEVELT
jgi:hypothetical protein